MLARSLAAYHAANVAIQSNIVQVIMGGCDFSLIKLVFIFQLEEILVAEVGVVIEVHFGIAHKHTAVVRLCEGIHFHHQTILLSEHLVQALDGRSRFNCSRSGKSEFFNKAVNLGIAEPLEGVDGMPND